MAPKRKPQPSDNYHIRQQHLGIVGRKNSLLTGRNLQQNQGGAAICRDQLPVRGGQQDKRHTVEMQSGV